MEIKQFNKDLIDFIYRSPTPYHAVQNMAQMFEKEGFICLDEREAWQLEPFTGYFVIREHSSIVAFITGEANYANQGFRMVGAHTDSPCLKVKPVPDIKKHNCFQLGIEVYGGALLAPWFDRDLSIAGQVSWYDTSCKSSLIDFKRPIATIPSLAIHLDSTQNKNRTINPQNDMAPLLAVFTKYDIDILKKVTFNHILLEQLKADQVDVPSDIQFSYDLFFYDAQSPSIIGLNENFISGARLDNLLSCFIGMKALTTAKQSCYPSLLVCNDHEEVGSVSSVGAQGTFLKHVLQRVCCDTDSYIRAMQNSFLISADNAHAVHPNFHEKHDFAHMPMINNGPVIKVNANQRYATNSKSCSTFRYLCEKEEVAIQFFSSRADMGCGSTIGPIVAAELGVRTIDVGLPTYGMHSIRELAGTHDAHSLGKVLKRFYNTYQDHI